MAVGINLCPICSRIVRRFPFLVYRRVTAKLGENIFASPIIAQSVFSRIISGRHASTSTGTKNIKIDLESIPTNKIRNFSIIAHIDHGKSTLADRLLEHTGTISKSSDNKQVLDKLQVERERGITVKAQTASLLYQHRGEEYLLNLIDTPGHVDFSYEVSRSLAACQGVLLLVDANQGVQAQTVANFYLAFERDLAIVPVLNKIDLKGADPDGVSRQLQTLFDIEPRSILKVSAKLGVGIDDLLQAIIEKVPPPSGDRLAPLKTLIFDSWFDRFRGVVCSIAVIDGTVRKGDRLTSHFTGKSHDVQETGIMYPDEHTTNVLYAGQVGYVYCGMKTTKEAQIGDTLSLQHHPVTPLAGFKPAKPMVFAGVYPTEQSEHASLRSAIEKLVLNDSSVSVNLDSSAALGQGWRLGFLGLLHMDVFTQRLEQEYDANVIITAPNVPYKVQVIGAKNIKQFGGEEVTILNPVNFPDTAVIRECMEPMVMSTIISPDTYVGSVTSLIMNRRGNMKEQTYIDDKRVLFKVIFPLNEIIMDFFDELKSITSGYASFDYEDYGYQETSLEKLTFSLNGQEVEELTMLCHTSQTLTTAKRVVAKLKEAIPRQMFEIAVQGKIGGRVLARENIKAYRKDVTAKLYGGDVTRRQKLLRAQAAGKKKMRMIGKVSVPKDAFVTVLRK